MHESTYHPCWANNTVSDIHSDWKDYGCSNYTVYARIDHVSKDENAAVRQMESTFEAKIEMERNKQKLS